MGKQAVHREQPGILIWTTATAWVTAEAGSVATNANDTTQGEKKLHYQSVQASYGAMTTEFLTRLVLKTTVTSPKFGKDPVSKCRMLCLGQAHVGG